MRIAPFKIERFYAQYEFTAPYMLSSSDCESMTIGDLLAYEPGAAERFAQHWLGYTESQGAPELRAALAGMYETLTPDHLLVCAGAEEGIFISMNALLTRGDHVIVHAPGYQSLHSVATSLGAEVSLWLTTDAENWELDLNWLADHIRPRTRMIVVNSPHNPTGYHMTPDKQRQIIDLARAHNLIVFSDEVYRGLEHDPQTRLPAAAELYENALSLGVLSKAHGLPGLRIGWLATRNTEFFRKVAAFKDYTTICNSAPGEFLATIAARQHSALSARCRALCLANLDLLDAFFARHTDLFTWQRPRANSTAFPRIHAPQGAEAFAIDVVQRAGVLLLPATTYDYGDRHVRVGFGRRNLPEALARFDEYLQREPATR